MAIELQQIGEDHFKIIEDGTVIGETWKEPENRFFPWVCELFPAGDFKGSLSRSVANDTEQSIYFARAHADGLIPNMGTLNSDTGIITPPEEDGPIN